MMLYKIFFDEMNNGYGHTEILKIIKPVITRNETKDLSMGRIEGKYGRNLIKRCEKISILQECILAIKMNISKMRRRKKKYSGSNMKPYENYYR